VENTRDGGGSEYKNIQDEDLRPEKQIASTFSAKTGIQRKQYYFATRVRHETKPCVSHQTMCRRTGSACRGNDGWPSIRALLLLVGPLLLFMTYFYHIQLSLKTALKHILENKNQQIEPSSTWTDNSKKINISIGIDSNDTATEYNGHHQQQNTTIFAATKVHPGELHGVPKEISMEIILRLWSTYRREHSEDALVKEWYDHQEQLRELYQSRNGTLNESGVSMWRSTTKRSINSTSSATGQQEHQRRYALALYSCPFQAGNRLHHFFNSVIWAVITNRTVLWKYYDKRACRRLGSKHSRRICEAANTEADCAKVLDRAAWIPSYDQWWRPIRVMTSSSPTQNASNTTMTPGIVEVSYWSTYDKLPHHKLWYDGAEALAGLADTITAPVVVYGQMLGQDASILQNPRKRNRLLTTSQARDRAETLLSLGADFLYGLIFHETLSIRLGQSATTTTTNNDDSLPSLSQSNHQHLNSANTSSGTSGSNKTRSDFKEKEYSLSESGADSTNIVTIALHSRHSNVDDDGSNIQREVNCIHKLLKEIQQTRPYFDNDNATTMSEIQCRVILMSDRNSTLNLLMDYLAQDNLRQEQQLPPKNLLQPPSGVNGTPSPLVTATIPHSPMPFPCRGIVVEHTNVSHSFKEEHGPFAGRGYFQDLALATSQARDGFIGANRSSSMLVRELIEYHRHMEAYHAWHDKKTNQTLQPERQLPWSSSDTQPQLDQVLPPLFKCYI
jgi:hypothetical protein